MAPLEMPYGGLSQDGLVHRVIVKSGSLQAVCLAKLIGSPVTVSKATCMVCIADPGDGFVAR